jgi:hypothetical protein
MKFKSRVASHMDLENDTSSARQCCCHEKPPLPSAEEEKSSEEKQESRKASRMKVFKQKLPKYAFVALKLGLVTGTLVAQLA